jgi:hypothetical protein
MNRLEGFVRMNLLIESRQFFGINAPLFAWVAAFILLLSALWAATTLFVKVYRFRASGRKLQSALAKLPKTTIGNALSLTELEQIRLHFTKLPLFARCWAQLQKKVIRRSGTSGDEYWLSAPASEILESSSVTDAYINREWYEAIPGILTGTGLLVTFVAILVALLHVRLVGNKIEGMALLIEGLSGKFISSIAALLAATLFVIFEKRQLHKLDRSVADLSDAVDAVIPALTTMHVLVELQKDMGEQSVAFRSFNADLAGRLKQSFSESMGPTLERMVAAVEDLNQLLRAAEAAKSDTISESLAGMISRLEASLTDSLGKMGEQFTSSLSGSTMAQFTRLSESVAGTASVLEQMNTQNQATQSALTELVTFAKNSTTEQMALGRSQIEDLTNVLRSVLTQIEQTTGSSVKDMGVAITALMSDLSTKVTELTEQSRTTMAQSSQASADAARSVLKDASDWSLSSKEQLAALIEKHTSQLNTVDRLRGALEESASRFNTSASQFTSILTKLQQIVADTSVCTTAMSGAAKSVKDSHDSLQRIAGLTSTQVENLALAGREQQNLIGRIAQAMQQYEHTFAKVETSASSLLQTLERNLSQHLELCRRGYESLVKVSDEHFASATQRLGATVNELEVYLQDLSEVLTVKSAGKAPNGN